jgi:hypothetical protein
MDAMTRLVTNSMDIALGAPRVINHRMRMMGPTALWSPTTLIEAQLMVWEKLHAAFECWLVVGAAAFAPAAWPALGAGAWTAGGQRRMAQHALRTAHRTLHPYSRRVKANVKRLR